MGDVGSNVLFEDDKIKVWDFNLAPGEETPIHTHHMEYVFYVIKGSTLDVFDAKGTRLEPLVLSDGDLIALRIEGDELVLIGEESKRVPVTHSARNAGPEPYRELLVEKKPAPRSAG